MEWTFPAAYGPEALAFLRADPVAHTVLLGVLAQKSVPHTTWAELRDDAGQVAGAAARCHASRSWPARVGPHAATRPWPSRD